LSVSRETVRDKAVELANEEKLENFSFSEDWLSGFLKRKHKARKKICGESESVDLQICDEWKAKLSLIIDNNSLKDVFNVDETALLWKQMNCYTISEKGKSCHGITSYKDRLSILLCISALGEKVPPLVIGKAENPRCFKSKDRNSFGVHYVSNKMGRMTKNLFETWLEIWNTKLASEDRKILLFLDNFLGHSVNSELSNIKLVFFPPNTTSHLQPLDAGSSTLSNRSIKIFCNQN